jgi:hypothetical protein
MSKYTHYNKLEGSEYYETTNTIICFLCRFPFLFSKFFNIHAVKYTRKDITEANREQRVFSQVLLALVALGTAESPSPTAATTTLSTSATPETPPKYDKGKRTTSAEVSPQNVEYRFSEEAQPASYITQQYVKMQSTKSQDLPHVPQKAVTEPKKKESPETTYTLQYVPVQYTRISHPFDILPKFQTAEYNQILQKTQQPLKYFTSAQNSIIPQQQYILPASFHSLTGSNPISATHYIPAPTTYHPSVPAFTPGHHISTYIVPQHSVPAYSLQPVVMFTLPGGHYLNTAAGQRALLSFLGGAGGLDGASSGRSAPSTPHVIPRQQLTYLIPPEAHPFVRQVSGTFYSIDRRSMLHKSVMRRMFKIS